MIKIFAILCHKWNENLSLTVNYLSSFHENTVLIHIDSKCELVEQFDVLLKDNVKILSTRFDIKWGNINMVNATLALMLESKSLQYDYFFLLSGEDIPVSNNAKINDILESSSGKDFIHIQDERNKYIDPYQRFTLIYPKLAYKKEKNSFEKIYLKLSMIIANKNNAGLIYLHEKCISLYKGTQWFTLKKQTVERILDFNQHNPSYLKIFEFSFCPDEIFFHSLVMSLFDPNRFIDKTKVNDCLRFMDWNNGPDYPKLLTKTEIFGLRDKGYFFARKVQDNFSKAEFMWLMA